MKFEKLICLSALLVPITSLATVGRADEDAD
jgi:hypothetical protein